MKLIIATKNKNKVKEIDAFFDTVFPRSMSMSSLDNLPEFEPWPDVVEDRETFEGNAIKKAFELALHAKRSVLSEDSGLVVDALDGKPGVKSARFAGPAKDHAANNARLVRELGALQETGQATPPFTARYVAVAALALFPDDAVGEWFLSHVDRSKAVEGEPGEQGQLGVVDGVYLIYWRGECEGEILLESQGDGGFGYDPHFYVPQLGKYMAELGVEQKGEISHRRHALQRMVDQLK